MNWGIIGYGEITPSFIVGLQAVSKSKLIGIASISSFEYLQKNKFYQKVQIFSNYEELAKHPEIDIIYVATTNNLHYENAKLVLNNNKYIYTDARIYRGAHVNIIIHARQYHYIWARTSIYWRARQ